jgi:PAS domain S-box-containing protein
LIFLFLALATGTIAIELFSSQNYERQFRSEIEYQLSAIGKLKSSQLVEWREERLGDGGILFRNQGFSNLVSRFFNYPLDFEAASQLQAWLGKYQTNFRYTKVLLLDTGGTLRMSVPAVGASASAQLTQDALAVLQSGEVQLLDIRRDSPTGDVYLAVAVPILNMQAGNAALGVLLLFINPDDTLYPFISSWPTPSTTAETLLVRRDGNDVVYLNPLKFRSIQPLDFRLPLSQDSLTSAMAIQGKTGIVEGVDYRGAQVVADLRPVAGSPWFLITRMDSEEVYAPLRARQIQNILMVLLALVTTGSIVVFLWRRERMRYLSTRNEALESLRSVSARQEAILSSVPDIIMEVDNNRVYTWSNRPGYEFFGDNVIGHQAADYFLGEQDTYSIVQPLFAGRSDLIYVESWQRRKDGERRLLAWWCRVLKDRDGHVDGVLSSARDITDLRTAEEQSRLAHERLELATRAAGMGIWDWNIQTDELIWDDRMYALYGVRREDFGGAYEAWLKGIHPEDRAASDEASDLARRGEREYDTEFRILRPDGEIRWIHSQGKVFRDEQGKPIRMTGVNYDITERKQAEERIRDSELRYASIFQASPEGILIAENETQKFRFANPAICKMLGYSAEELTSLAVTAIHPPEAIPQITVLFADMAKGISDVAHDIPCLRKDGSLIYVDIHSSVIKFDGAAHSLGIFTDITERKRAEEALRASETKFRSIFENSAAGIALVGLDGRYHMVNPAYCAIFGYSAEEFNSQTFLALTHPNDVERSRHLQQDVLAGKGRQIRFVKRYVHKDGHIIWADVGSSLIYGEDGNPSYFVTNLLDITEQKHLEDEIRESEDQFRYIFENSMIGNSITHLTGEIHVNKAFCDMLGYSSEELRQTRWQELTHPDDIAPTQAEMDALLRGEKNGARFVKRFLHKNGSVVWADIRSTLRRDLQGHPMYLMTNIHDITERMRAEAAITQAVKDWQTTFDSVDDTVWLLDIDQRIVRSNKAGERLFHRPVSEMIGRHCWEIVHGTPQPIPECPILRAKTSLHRESMELRLGEIWVEVTVDPILDTEGRYAGAVHLISDITGRKKADDEIRRLNADLERRVRERTAQLETTNMELEAFAYSVSHDLRAPLRGINGWSAALAEDYGGRLDERGHEYLDRIGAEAKHMGVLIDDLLKLSRVSRADMQHIRIDLSGLVASIVARLSEQQPKRKLEFSVEPGLSAEGDPNLLDIALTNLLDNACKFTGPRKVARIAFGRAGADHERAFFIRDNGVGFDMTYADKLFSPFQRLHKASEFPGTGIGLATVQRIIHRHGGKIWVDAAPDKGATFFFTLEERE